MTIQYVKTHSLSGLIGASNHALDHARAQGACATLVVPSHAWAQQRKQQLRATHPVGVNVQTYRQWVTELWGLYGTGSTVIEPAARSVLLRPLITQVGLLQSSPSPKLVSSLGAFVEEAAAPGLTPRKSLSESQAKLMELVSLYEHKLELEGHIELARAEAALVQVGACANSCVVFECPNLNSAHTRFFIGQLAHVSHVTVITQELDTSQKHVGEQYEDELEDLRNRLFSGVGGMHARGLVSVVEARGAHVSCEATVRLVRAIHDDKGIAYNDALLCLGNASDAYPRLFETLAQAGIPFVSEFSLPCARTAFGAAFSCLEAFLAAPEDESTYEYLVDFVCSPYSGIKPEDARALQMHWRERAHSTAAQRLDDIRSGFNQGNATSKIMVERLRPLADLLDAPRIERVRMMFEYARTAHVGADTLVDDRAAADGILDYLELCKRYLCEPNLEEIANLPVVLARSFGSQSQAMQIISARDLNLSSAQAIILTELDASHYPMARQEGPFDALMALLGIARQDTLAREQRILLLNCIEAAQSHFAFCRATHDAAGDELCQSALYEELLAVYRSPEDEKNDVKLHEIPHELLAHSLVLNESDVFFSGGDGAGNRVAVMRGMLKNSWSQNNLAIDLQGKPLPFSPTGLEDYYRCPYRWFACRRVGYNGMDNAFDAASQGNLVHAVMERFYKDLKASGYPRVTGENLPRALEIASAAFDAQVEHDKNRARGGLYLRTQRDERECEELRKCVLDLVERDAEFLPEFIPTYFELALGKGTGSMLEYAGVPVRGKVDRIDVDASGNAIIIDYKLSSLSAGYGFAAEEELPLRIQTDIYATLVQRHFEMLGAPIQVLGSVYRSYARNMMRGVYSRGIAWGEAEVRRDKLDALPRSGSDETYAEYLERVESVVSSCMQELAAGNIAPNPIADGVCEYCKACSFCPKGVC